MALERNAGLRRAASDAEIRSRCPEWREAALKCESLYATPEWTLSLWESHYNKTGVEFFFSPGEQGRFSALALCGSKVRKFGVAFFQVTPITNSYGNDNTFLLEGPFEQRVADLRTAMSHYEWDWLYVGSVLRSSRTEQVIYEFAKSIDTPVAAEPHWRSPYMSTIGTWEAYLASRTANFRSDMKRKWNKAIGAGAEFREVTQVHEVEGALEAVFDIESRSWKQDAGSSIARNTAAARFYQRFLPRAADRGWLNLHLLYVNGTAVAYDMGVTFRNKYYMLKTSFDGSMEPLSPGVVIRQHVVRGLFERGVSEHDFMGDADSYKLRWTSLDREHVNLRLFNPKRLRARLYSWLRTTK